MKKLYIIGARGFGREVFSIAQESIGYNKDFEIKGYLDSNDQVLNEFPGYPPIISSVEEFTPSEDDVFICALGDVKYRKKYVEIILRKGGEFINIVHQTASLAQNAEMGTGCILGPYSRLSNDTRIGNFTTMHQFSGIGHDAIVGDYCELETHSCMGGGAELGDGVTLHPSAIILPHKRVGHNSIIGAGAVVMRNVKEGSTMYGNPAKKLIY